MFPAEMTIKVVIDLSSLEAILARVLTSFLQATEGLVAPQPAQNTDPLPVSSLPAQVDARAVPAGADPVATKPPRTRRTKAEMAALRAAGLPTRPTKSEAAQEATANIGATAGAGTLPPASVPSVAPVTAAPVAPPPAPPAPVPVLAPSGADLFGAAPVAASTALASDEQVAKFKKFITDEFLPNQKGGYDNYNTIRASLGTPVMAGITLDMMQRWEAALRAQLNS